MKNLVRKIPILLLAAPVALTSCTDDDLSDHAEDAADAVEDTVEDVADKAEEAGEEIKDAVDD